MSTSQQDYQVRIAPNKEQECNDKANETNETKTMADIKPMGHAYRAEHGTVAILMFEEEEEEEAAREEAKVNMVSMHALEEEESTEDEAEKTQNTGDLDMYSTDDDTMSIAGSS